jgi:hypothetical protein
MESLTQMTLTKLTAAETYKLHLQKVRRQNAIDRMTAEVQADIKRIQALYAEGSTKRLQPAPEPTFKEAATFTTTRLPGGAEASVAAEKGARTRRERQGRVLDMSPEAVAKREARRARRAARKARKAAALA